MTEGECNRLRTLLHDLSNLLTGILVSGGLLRMAMQGDARRRYADDVCESGEKGAVIIREARNLLLSPEERMQPVSSPEN